MSRINPYLRFNDGKCREAMNFYKDCLGGELELMTLGESPMAKDSPGKENLIMHATLKKGGAILIQGSDMMRDKMKVGDNVVVSVDCESEKEIEDIFAKLSKGADIFMKLEKQFWGGLYGMLTDKYGHEWMFNYQEKK